jgi:hypothetical protein
LTLPPQFLCVRKSPYHHQPTNMSDKRSTYVLIGRTNLYQAQAGRHFGFFRGRALAASQETHNCTESEAADKIMAMAEKDNDAFVDETTGILLEGCIHEVSPGQLNYHHDGYSWSMVKVEDLDFEEAKTAIRDGAWLSDDELEKIYSMHEDLRPPAEDEEE